MKIRRIFLFLKCYSDSNTVFASAKQAPGGRLPAKILLMLRPLKIEWDVFIFVVWQDGL